MIIEAINGATQKNDSKAKPNRRKTDCQDKGNIEGQEEIVGTRRMENCGVRETQQADKKINKGKYQKQTRQNDK